MSAQNARRPGLGNLLRQLYLLLRYLRTVDLAEEVNGVISRLEAGQHDLRADLALTKREFRPHEYSSSAGSHLNTPTYDLSHLIQPEKQDVMGPIQDDEALFLYALVRGMRLTRILEIGGLNGYSSDNFLRALRGNGVLYTIDINPAPKLGDNHKVIVKDAAEIRPEDIGNKCLDLIFFDCHVYDAQMSLFLKLEEQRMIDDHTILVLHDTNLHPQKFVDWAYPIDGGYVHQAVERYMVNELKERGYDVFSLHPKPQVHDDRFPYRHGLTVCQKFKKFAILPPDEQIRLLTLHGFSPDIAGKVIAADGVKSPVEVR